MGRAAQNICFNVIGLYYSELFPTCIRGLATLITRAFGIAGIYLFAIKHGFIKKIEKFGKKNFF